MSAAINNLRFLIQPTIFFFEMFFTWNLVHEVKIEISYFFSFKT